MIKIKRYTLFEKSQHLNTRIKKVRADLIRHSCGLQYSQKHTKAGFIRLSRAYMCRKREHFMHALANGM